MPMINADDGCPIHVQVEGRDVIPSPEPAPAEPASLLDALQASLDATTKERPAAAKRRPARRASA